ncbi:MAG: hypothetical protein GYB49_13180 [Alphaproteobacteria bacterium]|nr:hypothetical protein [Hyphomonas sp.]MBR9808163.1 hypothetical protein [Alphaproteobacteria bacterium]
MMTLTARAPRPFVLGLAALGLSGLMTAGADTYSDQLQAMRAEINPLSDRAAAGDEAALDQMIEWVEICYNNKDCTEGSEMRLRAAQAASNLGWLYQKQNHGGEEGQPRGVAFYVLAARWGNPFGYYNTAECLLQGCLAPEYERDFFSQVLGPEDTWPPQTDYERQSLAASLFGKAGDAGMTMGYMMEGSVRMSALGVAAESFAQTEKDWDSLSEDEQLDILEDEKMMAANRALQAFESAFQSNPTDEELEDILRSQNLTIDILENVPTTELMDP